MILAADFYNMLKIIKKFSPNLHLTIERILSLDEVALLDNAFSLAISHEGLKEIDFQREEGVSYNPRPARVALILINNAKVTDNKIIATSFLANIEAAVLKNLVSENIPSEYFQNALLAKNPFLLQNENKEIKLISLALRLDRVRHHHLSKELNSKEKWQEFLEENQKYIELAGNISPEIHLLLQKWQERAIQKGC